MSAYPRPIFCARCLRDLRPEKNGVYLLEMAGDPPQPYALWHADLWTCPECKTRIISGYGGSPVRCSEGERFKTELKRARESRWLYLRQEVKE